MRCTWTGRINLKIFLGYDFNYLSICPFMRHPWFPTRKASKLTFVCFQLAFAMKCLFIQFLLFVLFQFWNSSQRNGGRLQSFGDVRFSRWNRFLKQNQPFNSRPHTYFQSRSQCNCQRMKLNLQLFEGNPQYYYCILHSQYIEYLANFFLYLLAEKSITEYLAVLWHSTLLTSMK